MKHAIFGTRIACTKLLMSTQHLFIVVVHLNRYAQRARRCGRERERERERKKECVCASERPRSAVLAISSFTYFCVGNMLLNMLKLKYITYTSSYVSLY